MPPSGSRSRRYERRRRIRTVGALLAAAAATSGLAVAAIRHVDRPVSHAGTVVGYTPPTQQHQLTVAFLGDSYTGGSDMGGNGPNGYPMLLAKRYGFHPIVNAVGGTGFVAPGPAKKPLTDLGRLSDLLARSPDVVIVAGGHNDNTYPAARVRRAAAGVLGRIRQQDPHATVVVVGPFWPGNIAPSGALAVRDALRGLAKSNPNTRWIDPIAEGVFAGKYLALIGSDGTHPTNAGHRHIADVLGRDLTRLRVLTRH